MCEPISCTYNLSQKGNILFVLTILLGFLGGLIIVLRFSIPSIVTWYFNRSIPSQEVMNMVSATQRIKNIWYQVKTTISEVNLFETAETQTNHFDLITGRITTRVYFICLIVSVIIIIFYTSVGVRMQNETVLMPSETVFQMLYDKYQNNLQCPCSKITIPYGSFISISPVYHPVCTSWLVSKEWIEYLAIVKNIVKRYPNEDFRINAPNFFDALSSLCDLSERTVNNSWQVVDRSVLVSDEVSPKEYLFIRVNARVNLFKTKAVHELTRSLAMINVQTRTMFIPGRKDIKFMMVESSSHIETNKTFYMQVLDKSDCACALDEKCLDSVVFLRYYTYIEPTSVFSIPNMFSGCSTTDSVLLSSLKCFYNQSCVDKITFLLNVSTPMQKGTPALVQNASQFSSNSVLSKVIDELMIDQWNVVIDYTSYYNQCKPLRCSYTYAREGGVVYIFSTIISVFGGLAVILKLFTRTCVRFIRNRVRLRTNNGEIESRSNIFSINRHAFQQLKQFAFQLNLFESKLSWHDHRIRQVEVITTKLYIFLLAFCIMIAAIYTSSMIRTRIVTVNNPSKEVFNELDSNPISSSTLDCPCQNLTIPYNQFVQISSHFHQICFSDFVIYNAQWGRLFSRFVFDYNYSYNDFQYFVVPQFRALTSLCTVSQQIVNEALSGFMSDTMITRRVESVQLMESKTSTTIERLRLSTCESFILMFSYTKDISYGNRIISSTFSNWLIEPLRFYNGEMLTGFHLSSRSYDNRSCSCNRDSTCSMSATIDGWIVPGFRVGCYLIESLLQSTLECLYDSACINMIIPMNSSSNMIFHALDSTLSSPNVTVRSLLESLLVEKWEKNISYDEYYAACAPRMCTYTMNTRFDKVYVFTTIAGLSGGLTEILKLVVPVLVKIGRKLLMHFHRQIEPIVPQDLAVG